jgi:hypothetical protein
MAGRGSSRAQSFIDETKHERPLFDISPIEKWRDHKTQRKMEKAKAKERERKEKEKKTWDLAGLANLKREKKKKKKKRKNRKDWAMIDLDQARASLVLP